MDRLYSYALTMSLKQWILKRLYLDRPTFKSCDMTCQQINSFDKYLAVQESLYSVFLNPFVCNLFVWPVFVTEGCELVVRSWGDRISCQASRLSKWSSVHLSDGDTHCEQHESAALWETHSLLSFSQTWLPPKTNHSSDTYHILTNILIMFKKIWWP